MKLLKTSFAVLILGFGSICLMSAACAPFYSNMDRQEKEQGAMACLLLGLPLTASGGWLLWNERRKSRKADEQRLQAIFYEQLKLSQGSITVAQFAVENNLTPSFAKQYIEEKAKELNATFEINENGDIYYHFSINKKQ